MKRKKLLSTKKVDIRSFPTSSSTNPAIYNMDTEQTIDVSGFYVGSPYMPESSGDILELGVQLMPDDIISLQKHGDKVEHENYEFINDKFPKYEQWWKVNVVPLTNRYSSTYPNIHFKSDGELEIIEKGYSDIMLAQMSYTVLIHLLRLKTLLDEGIGKDQYRFYEFFSRSSALIDVALDFIVLRSDPSIQSKLNTSRDLGKMLRDNKLKLRRKDYGLKIKNYKKIEGIRWYRNSLLHGVILPTYYDYGKYPLIDKVGYYEDWRRVTNKGFPNPAIESEFADPQTICAGAFQTILDFLDQNC